MKINDLFAVFETMPDIMERATAPAVLDFVPVLLKKELRNAAGATFLPQIYYVNPDNGEICTIKDGNLTGYAFTDTGGLLGWEWSTGNPVTIRDFITLATNDPALSPLIDMDRYNAIFDDLAGQISFDDLAEPPKIEPAPLKLATTKAGPYTVSKDKLTRYITKLQNNEEVDLVTLDGNAVGITAKAWRRHAKESESLDLTADGSISAAKNVITPSMLPILNALNSIWNQAAENNAAPAFTLTRLYNQIHGIEQHTHIPQSALEELRRALDEMQDIFMKIDATKEITARYKDDTITASDLLRDTWEGSLIAIDKRRVEVGGFVGEGYILLRRPLNYQAIRVSRQIITLPAKSINTPRLNNSLFVASLRDYLFSEVDYMEHDEKRNNRIRYQTIYDYLGITPANYKNVKDKKKKTRDQVKRLLDHMQEIGRIKAYTEYNKRNTIAGIEITLLNAPETGKNAK